jgi:hypothetical protein
VNATLAAQATGGANSVTGGTTVSPTNLTTTVTTSQTPLIMPGLFTAINAESARPMDRIFTSYGYYDSFKVASPTGVIPGFNLHRFDIGAEKTFFDGAGSIYVRVPFLDATSNVSGQPIDGVGDISAGIKFALFANKETGSTFSVGMTVSAPTARDAVVTTTQVTSFSIQPTNFSAQRQTIRMPSGSVNLNRIQFTSSDVNGGTPTPLTTTSGGPLNPVALPASTSTTVNPTFLQPWVGGLLVLDRLYVQEYLGVVIPTDDRTSTFINNDVGIGYQIYRSPGCWLSSITPTIDVQLLLPINHQGSVSGSTQTIQNTNIPPDGQVPAVSQPAAANSFNSPYQVFVSEGLQFGIGERALLSGAVSTPVTGPKAYTVGFSIGFNLFF